MKCWTREEVIHAELQFRVENAPDEPPKVSKRRVRKFKTDPVNLNQEERTCIACEREFKGTEVVRNFYKTSAGFYYSCCKVCHRKRNREYHEQKRREELIRQGRITENTPFTVKCKRLQKETVRELRDKYKAGATPQELVLEYGLTNSVIHRILYNKHYFDPEYEPPTFIHRESSRKGIRLTDEEVLGMRELRQQGKSYDFIALHYATPYSTVVKVCTYVTHKDLKPNGNLQETVRDSQSHRPTDQECDRKAS